MLSFACSPKSMKGRRAQPTWVVPSVLAVIALIAAITITAEPDYSLYSPGPQVRRWRSDFGLVLDELGSDEMFDYATDVGVKRVAPIMIVGVLAFFGLLIWACCRCGCGCCKPKCHLNDTSSCCKLIITLMLLATLISGIALISVGFEADRRQSDAVTSLPKLVGSVVDVQTETGELVKDLLTVAQTVEASCNRIIAEDDFGFISDADANALAQTFGDIADTAGVIDADINSIDFADFETVLAEDINSYDEKRHDGFVIVLAVLLTLVLLEGFFSLLNAYGSDGCKPKKNCFNWITLIIGFISIIILLLLWILSGFLVGLLTASSDVCYDPNMQFTALLTSDGSSQADQLVTFFFNCGNDASVQNPSQSDIDDVVALTELANTTLASLSAQLDNANCDFDADTRAACDAIETEFNLLETQIASLEDILGVSTFDSSNNAQDGFLRLAGCYGINERYQLTLRTFCGNGVEALGKSTEVVLGFAVIYVFTQVLIKLVTDTGMQKDKTDVDYNVHDIA